MALKIFVSNFKRITRWKLSSLLGKYLNVVVIAAVLLARR